MRRCSTWPEQAIWRGPRASRSATRACQTDEQNLALQLDALHQAGCTRVYKDVGSGSLKHRPELDACLDYLRAGDTLVVWRLDRLERGLKHLIELTRPFRYRFGLDRLPLITIPSAGPGRMG